MAEVAHDLKLDNDLISCQWFSNDNEVTQALNTMLRNGWTPGRDGLMSVNENGNRCIAKPMKIYEKLARTGICIWKLSDIDES